MCSVQCYQISDLLSYFDHPVDPELDIRRYKYFDDELLQFITCSSKQEQSCLSSLLEHRNNRPEMSTSNRKSERLQKKKSAPAPDLQVPGTSKQSNKKEIDDVSLLLTIKPIVATLLEYLKEVEDHTDSEQKQPGNDDPMAVERLKYTQLRDIFLKIVHKKMSKCLQLHRKKVETDNGVLVTKKIVNNVIAMLIQAMMFMGRDIE
uniref:Uncharacterized protein n=2 Tax=root TaxID=1 RepID=R9XKM0_9VIRU|nr:hypothetical protein CsmBV18.1 [Cotesia sesamiae Mombasa bracovirus]